MWESTWKQMLLCNSFAQHYRNTHVEMQIVGKDFQHIWLYYYTCSRSVNQDRFTDSSDDEMMQWRFHEAVLKGVVHHEIQGFSSELCCCLSTLFLLWAPSVGVIRDVCFPLNMMELSSRMWTVPLCRSKGAFNREEGLALMAVWHDVNINAAALRWA